MFDLQWVASEVIVGGVLVNLGVVEDLVAVDSPLAIDPHVDFLVQDAFLGELVGDVGLARHLVRRRSRVLLVVHVLVVRVAGRGSECAHLHLSERQRSFLLQRHRGLRLLCDET